ncbi:MAG: relaxase/mobilization nuclease domain-containing protein [Arcanobacterium sp.]|nr:relaxase/mobilization nuclease domain-containing protein [Arcanobacterium sp.]
MATTKILQIRSDVLPAVKYVLNRDKTLSSTLVSSNCGLAWDAADIASAFRWSEEAALKHRGVGRLGSVKAFHLIQSFVPGEITDPDLAHNIGLELVEKLLGGNHDFVIATHIDRAHVHNHILFSPINKKSWRRFRVVNILKIPVLYRTWYRIARLSDEICSKYGLSVLPDPKLASSSQEIGVLYARAEGRSKRDVLKKKIDLAVVESFSFPGLVNTLAKQGVQVEVTGAGLRFIAPGLLERPIRGSSLGAAYFGQGLMTRLGRSVAREIIVAKSLVRRLDETRYWIQLPGVVPPKFMVVDKDFVVKHPNNFRLYLPSGFETVLVDRFKNYSGMAGLETVSEYFSTPLPVNLMARGVQLEDSGHRVAKTSAQAKYFARIEKTQARAQELADINAVLQNFENSENHGRYYDRLEKQISALSEQVLSRLKLLQVKADESGGNLDSDQVLKDLQRKLNVLVKAKQKIDEVNQSAPDLRHGQKNNSRHDRR